VANYNKLFSDIINTDETCIVRSNRRDSAIGKTWLVAVAPYPGLYTVFQKSDAKIQITIITTYLVRINHPLSSFNYRPSDTNVANFNKIDRTLFEQQLFKQAAQLSQRDRAAGWVSYRQKWKTGTGRQYLWTL